MRPFWRRRPEAPDMDDVDKIVITTKVDEDPTRPTECQCGARATMWVSYLWRRMEEKSFVSGHTTEDVCQDHYHSIQNDPDTFVQDWGRL